MKGIVAQLSIMKAVQQASSKCLDGSLIGKRDNSGIVDHTVHLAIQAVLFFTFSPQIKPLFTLHPPELNNLQHSAKAFCDLLLPGGRR